MLKPGLSILLIFSCSIGMAQRYDEGDFDRLTVDEGLSDNFITSIQQDEWGHIWIGTDAGLNRFDGHSFQVYTPSSSILPLLSGKISRLKTIDDHHLGIINHGGFQLLDTRNLSLQNFLAPDSTVFGITLNRAFDATQLPEGRYAVSTASGFYVYDQNGRLHFRHDAYTAADIGKKRIFFGHDIYPLEDGRALLFMEGNGMAVYDPRRRELKAVDSLNNRWLPLYRARDAGGQLWESRCQLADGSFLVVNVASNSISYLGRDGKSVSSPLPHHCAEELGWASRITPLGGDHFALNCGNRGFYLLSLQVATGIVNCDTTKYLPSLEINSLLVDKDGRLWVGTSQGLFKQRLKKPFLQRYFFAKKDELMPYNEELTCAFRYKDKLYLGMYSRNAGILVVDTATMQVVQKISLFQQGNPWNEVISMQLYHPDTLWIGTNNGIAWLDTKTGHYGDVLAGIKNVPPAIRAKLLPQARLAKTISLQPISKFGDAWIAFGLRGLVARYEPGPRKWSFFSAETRPALPFNAVKQIAYDSEGDVWISGIGLSRWNRQKQLFDTLMTSYAGPMKYNANILSMAGDNRGSLWIHNEENGLLEYETAKKRFNVYGSANGLRSNLFECFSDVIGHVLWMANSTSISCWDVYTREAIVFGHNDGVSFNKPTARKMYYDSSTKQLYLLCGDEVVRFSARQATAGVHPGKVLLEDIATTTQTLSYPPDNLAFSPNTNNILLHFTVVDYEAANGYTFAYRLSDADGWTSLNRDRSLRLTDLPPGRYQVELQAVSKWGKPLAMTYRFTINPHFWQTGWFKAAAAFVLLGLLYGFYRVMIGQVRRKADVDRQLAKMEMKALHAQMNPHFIFNSLNSIKEMVLCNENEEASNYLIKFAGLIRITLEQSTRSFITLRSTIDYLDHYVAMEKIRNDHFDCPITVDDQIDPDETFLPPMLIQPFIENAIWHGISGPKKNIRVEVNFCLSGQQLVCVVADNGIGINRSLSARAQQDRGPSYGISNIRKRILLLNEKYKLESSVTIVDKSTIDTNSTGTIVTLTIPPQIANG